MNEKTSAPLILRAAATGLVQLAGAGVVFVMHAAVATKLGPESYGTFAHALALAGLVGMLATLGWNNASVRFVAHYENAKSWGMLRAFRIRSGQVVYGASTLLAIGLGLASLLGFRPDLRLSILTAAVLIPVYAGMELNRRTLQGFGHPASSLVPEQILLPALMCAWVWSSGSDLRSAMVAFVVLGVGCLLVAHVQARRAFPVVVRETSPQFRTRDWFAVALPLMGGSVAYLVLNRADVVLLGLVADMAVVGEYAAARRVVMLGTLALAALNIVAGPSFAAAHGAGDLAEFRAVFRRVQRLSWAVGFPVFVAFLILPAFPLRFFGMESGAAPALLRILVLGQVVNVATGPVGMAMSMGSLERSQAAICGACAIGMVVLFPLALRIWGVEGAAWVTAGTIAVQNLSMLAVLSRSMKRAEVDGGAS
jgi:O-antigen/teichoic acid export membrane protein